MSGDWRSVGAPVICGQYATGSTSVSTRQGTGAVSCVRGVKNLKSSIVLIGIRLLEGATPGTNLAAYSGGGAYGVTLRNCLVADCAGRDAGGCSLCDTFDCTVRDCYASNLGGGVGVSGTHSNIVISTCESASHGGGADAVIIYDSIIINCSGKGYCGGARSSIVYGTKFVDCMAGSYYGGALFNSTAYNCTFLRCNRGAAANSSVYDSEFIGCTGGRGSTYDWGSACTFMGSANIVSNCTFRGNESPVIGSLNAGNGARMIDCIVEDNEGTALVCNYNGAVYYVINSYVSCTNPANYAVLMNSYQGSGKNLNSVNATNSTFVGAIRGGGDFHNCLFIDGASSVDSIFYCNEKLATYSGKTVPLNLYNCTAMGNTSTFGAVVDGGYVNAYNSVVRGNVGKSGLGDQFATAKNCCLDDAAVAETEADCIRADPLFITDDRGLPHPSETSPCRADGDLAFVATEFDLAGNPRTSTKDGKTVVAMGACEFDPNIAGAEISCAVQDAAAPASGTFTVSCSGLGAEGLVYYWDFDGDGTIDVVTTDPACRYSYPLAGAYTATLYVSNAVKGVTATFLIEVPEGYFVSSDEIGEDGRSVYTTSEGYRHPAYADLQQAIDAAPDGGIVWVKDGFECKTGSSSYQSADCRIRVDKQLTLRGESGNWQTGPIIRGKYANACTGTASTRAGSGAISCVRGSGKANVTLVGFRLFEGATPFSNAVSGSGGCAYGVTLRNCYCGGGAAYYGGAARACDTYDCTVFDCYAYQGGGLHEATHSNDWIEACTTTYMGGGLASATAYDCVITNCVGGDYGGGIGFSSSYRCTIVNCTAGVGGGVHNPTMLQDSEIIGCNGSAVHNGHVEHCVFRDSKDNGVDGSAFRFTAANLIVSNCTFVGNAEPVVGMLAGAGNDQMVDCVFTNNLGTVINSAHNPNGELVLRRCRIECTTSDGYAVKTRRYSSSGTKLNYVSAYDCVISGPISGSGAYYNCLITGAKSINPAVFCDTSIASYTGAAVPLELYNCTVASNCSASASGGVGGDLVVAVNSIVRENVGKDGAVDSYLAASNSCVEADAVIGDAYRCTTERPRFDKKTPGREFVPRASALRGTAQVFDWMSDPADPRSRDLAGRDRITDGAPDMGAFEMYPPVGLLLMVR